MARFARHKRLPVSRCAAFAAVRPPGPNRRFGPESGSCPTKRRAAAYREPPRPQASLEAGAVLNFNPFYCAVGARRGTGARGRLLGGLRPPGRAEARPRASGSLPQEPPPCPGSTPRPSPLIPPHCTPFLTACSPSLLPPLPSS